MDWFGEQESDSPGGSESNVEEDAHPNLSVECSVPGCTKGKISLSAGLRGSHSCKHCHQRFHATCAWEVSNSDDPCDCGCRKRAAKDLEVDFCNAASNGTQDVQQDMLDEEDGFLVIAAPEDYNEEEIEAWHTVIKISQAAKLRKLPAAYALNWTEEQQAVWDPARDALNKEKRRLKAKSSRNTKKTAAVATVGHTQEPDWRAAAGMPDTSLSHKQEPPFSGHERARLVHCLAEPCMREYIPHLLRGATIRTEIDDKVSLCNWCSGGSPIAMGDLRVGVVAAAS